MNEPHRNGREGITPSTSRILTSLIGPGVVIRGTITDSEDTLAIRGRVEGAIEHDDSVLVDKQGVVRAEIKAKEIQVSGSVIGNMHGEERVRIDAGGVVEGDIQTRRFSVEEGAKMKGRVIMTSTNAPGTTAKNSAKLDSSKKGPKPVNQSTETEAKHGTTGSVK
jgi:cytoskeletal protein CcmA (bactofilin family)